MRFFGFYLKAQLDTRFLAVFRDQLGTAQQRDPPPGHQLKKKILLRRTHRHKHWTKSFLKCGAGRGGQMGAGRHHIGKMGHNVVPAFMEEVHLPGVEGSGLLQRLGKVSAGGKALGRLLMLSTVRATLSISSRNIVLQRYRKFHVKCLECIHFNRIRVYFSAQ